MLKKVNDSIQVFEWSENITLKNVEQFRQDMEKFIHYDVEHLILNLANTNYINSAGLGIIADSVMQARKSQKELVIAEIQQSVKDIFTIVKFTSFMKVFESEIEAIKYFGESK